MATTSNPAARPIAVTMGDPSGIGPDIILMSWRNRREARLQPFLVTGCPQVFTERTRTLGIDVPLEIVDSAERAVDEFETALPIFPVANCTEAQPGKPDASTAASVIQAIDCAVGLAGTGHVSAVVTAPISKKHLHSAGFRYPGHTEYLAELCRKPGRSTLKPVMMLAAGTLRVVPVTIHIPLRDVPRALTAKEIIDTIEIAHAELIGRFGISTPRIAVAGLNPHAGEDGMLGSEDIEVIAPAIEHLQQQGMDVQGPLPADALFQERSRVRYDLFVAMYHDQALIPIKTLAFDEAVNITLGLPIVRTSPDHGTAYDLAGTGDASPASMMASIRMAAALAASQTQLAEAT